MADPVHLKLIDTCVLIDIVTGDPRYTPTLDPIVKEAERGLLRLGIFEITVAEACKLKPKLHEEPFVLIERWLANRYAQRFPTTPSVSQRAAVLIKVCSLETCDAIVVATALAHGAKTLYTRDSDSLYKQIRKSQIAPSSLAAKIDQLRADGIAITVRNRRS